MKDVVTHDEVEVALKDIFSENNYTFNDKYFSPFIKPGRYRKLQESLSVLRRNKIIVGGEYHFIANLLRHYYKHYSRFQEQIRNEPRKFAQAFIGKKKIREFIFKRDKKCLKCGNNTDLTIDHINPIYCGGENKLSNLQTLCKSCNSSKGTNYKDYRNGTT